MTKTDPDDRERAAPISMTGDEFREAGHALVEAVARFMDDMPAGQVTPGESPAVVRRALGDFPAPIEGTEPGKVLAEATDLLLRHSLFNG
ncbi:MAG: hypothetical protein R3282_03870, partial [Rhodothermales bacterium]|nr:hypothetical protein [Rhodothermales bacterium]